MSEKTKPADRFRDPNLAPSLAVKNGFWRYPLDHELPALVDALAKLVGREAKIVSWQRRLACTSDGTSPLIIVNAPARVTSPNCDDHIQPWRDPQNLAVTQLVLPISDAVELLASPHNPELEIERRAKLCQAHAEDEQRKAKTRAEANAAREKAEAAAAKERLDYKADLWERMDPLQQCFLRLAVAVEGKDKALAASIRSVVNTSIQEAVAGTPPDFPRATWDAGLSWPAPPRGNRPARSSFSFASAADICAQIPAERMKFFRIVHGLGPVADAKIARQWMDSLALAEHEHATAGQAPAAAQPSPSAPKNAEDRARARREQDAQADREMSVTAYVAKGQS
jgi:hypothetical protein